MNNGISQNNPKDWCLRCLQPFWSKNKYENHLEECIKVKPNTYCSPENNDISFTKSKIKQTQKIPYVIYADFESIIAEYQLCTNNPNESWTYLAGKHIASSFCAAVIDFNGKLIDKKEYLGYNAAEEFNRYIHN